MSTPKPPFPTAWITILATVVALLVSGAMSWGVTQEHVANDAVHSNAELVVFRLLAIEARLMRIEELLGDL